MAFTETKKFETIMGDRIFGCYRLTGDASDVSWVVPVGVLDSVWVQPYFGTGVTGASTWEYTYTGHTITFITTLSTGEFLDVFYIGV
uniref:Uncharacterized protein n=1 Tax=viral metagenome TaxID=1070528 RepID=A0A6M3K5B8_9ZZZZ